MSIRKYLHTLMLNKHIIFLIASIDTAPFLQMLWLRYCLFKASTVGSDWLVFTSLSRHHPPHFYISSLVVLTILAMLGEETVKL